MPNPSDKSRQILTPEDVVSLKRMAESGELAKCGVRLIQIRHSDGTVEEPIRIPPCHDHIAQKSVEDILSKIREKSSTQD